MRVFFPHFQLFQCDIPWEEHFVITTCSMLVLMVCVLFFSFISFSVVVHTCSSVWRQSKMCWLKMGHKWSITNFYQCYCFVFKKTVAFFSSSRIVSEFEKRKKTQKHFYLHWIDWDARFGTMSMIRCCFEPIELPEFFDTVIQKCTDPGCKLNKGSKHLLHNRPNAIAVDRHINAVFVIIHIHRVLLFFWSYAIHICVCCVLRETCEKFFFLFFSKVLKRPQTAGSWHTYIDLFRCCVRWGAFECIYVRVDVKYIIENRCNDRSKCQNINFSQTFTLVIAQN